MSSELYELVLREDRAYLERRSDRRVLGALTRLEAAALKMLAEGMPCEQVKEVWQSVVPLRADQVLERVNARFLPLLAEGRGVAAPISFETLKTIQPPALHSSLRELPGPKVLHWCVTRYCPRKCVYCYAEPQHGARSADASVTRSELKSIFQEAAALGAQHLLVAGAEPFLRPDLPEVMGDAIEQGLIPVVTTKHPIDEQLADRLAQASVKHISLSFDSDSSDEALLLIGSRSYPEQVRRSIGNLTRSGVQFSLQLVATRLNDSGIAGVAKMASELDAVVMQVVPFENVRKNIGQYDNRDMMSPDLDMLREMVEQLARRFANVKFELFEKLGSGARSRFHCDIGMTKLFFLPDGVVHRCYKLIDDLTLCGKDLKRSSVAEAWHDPSFSTIISPPRPLYQESACGTCSRFGDCHSEGRCIYKSSVTNGTYFSIDRSCEGSFSPVHKIRDVATS